MNVLKSRSSTIFILLVVILIPLVESIAFNFSSFQQNTKKIFYQGDAFSAGGVIEVTKNQLDSSLIRSVGRASYASPIRIWDRGSGKLTDFTSHFSFIINALNAQVYGHGLCFFLAPFDAEIPANSSDGYLGLFSNTTASTPTASSSGLVAVEFDTFKDPWDPSSDHVGININSIVSVANVTWKSSMKNGSRANAWVSYNSSTKNLSVFLTYAKNPTFNGNSSLSHMVDLRDILPEWVRVGFSAATGKEVELHTILTWNFQSTLEGKGKNRSVIIGLGGGIVGAVLLVTCLGLFWLTRRTKWANWLKKEPSIDYSVEEDFQQGATGPKRFTFHELNRATNNFAEEGKLGEGGFGSVYVGLLRQTKVAVKRVSRGSKQGKKEYSSEVRIISRLRHKNLVQLIGWCHGQGELLLVYEFLPNGSLDSHLFGRKPRLPWPTRYKIAQGLASALLYLHEEWEQCVVHRDVKSSNVMLDSNYNAKLSDFGLARLVDHELGSQTTVLAGTMGYLAPECVTTGRASRKSDVYSFGVVSLEITCGRQAIDLKAEPGQMRLVEWVWGLYGNGKLVDATDKRLIRNDGFEERQLECLMVVGLWCCHPDQDLRPSMRQVINVLNFEAPLPCLPSKQPEPIYFAPPMNTCKFSYTSTESGNKCGHANSSCSRCSSSVSAGAGSSKSLLQLHSLPM